MVLDEHDTKAIRQRSRLRFRKREGGWWPRRAAGSIERLRDGDATERAECRCREYCATSRESHGAAFGAGGVTFVYGASGLAIRSSFPAGTMLITTRAAVR